MCRVFHRYGKWSRPFNSKKVRSRGEFGNTSQDDVVVQERKCSSCNYVQVRIVRDGRIEDKFNGGESE